jgi:hypothetical protein
MHDTYLDRMVRQHSLVNRAPSNLCSLRPGKASVFDSKARLPLEFALERCTNAECSIILDRLFGILNLAIDGAGFPVDYNDRPVDVLSKAARHFRTAPGSESVWRKLDILLGHPVRHAQWSWNWPLFENKLARQFTLIDAHLSHLSPVDCLHSSITSWIGSSSSPMAMIEADFCVDFTWRKGSLTQVRLGYRTGGPISSHRSWWTREPKMRLSESFEPSIGFEMQKPDMDFHLALCWPGDFEWLMTPPRAGIFKFVLAAQPDPDCGDALAVDLMTKYMSPSLLQLLLSRHEKCRHSDDVSTCIEAMGPRLSTRYTGEPIHTSQMSATTGNIVHPLKWQAYNDATTAGQYLEWCHSASGVLQLHYPLHPIRTDHIRQPLPKWLFSIRCLEEQRPLPRLKKQQRRHFRRPKHGAGSSTQRPYP